MYDQESHDSSSSDGEFCPSNPAEAVTPPSSAEPSAKQQANAVMLQCPYCRKEFARSTTQSMPFCSSRCKQIDLGLWLNEVHGMPYDIDPGVS